MKHYLFFAFFFLGCVQLYAQEKVIFHYDAAGNRGSASRIMLRSSNAIQTSDSISEEARQVEKEGISSELSTCKVTIYPNPTEGEVQLAISGSQEDVVSEIRVYSYSGQFLLQLKATGNELVSVNLSNYPSGSYLLHFKHGENTTSYTIIKQ